MRIPVRTEHGWQIDAILDTTYVATKDGEKEGENELLGSLARVD